LAIAEPERYAIEPKVDGVRGLIVYRPDSRIEARNRSGRSRDWFRHRPFAAGVRGLAERLPILWDGTVLDGELRAGRFSWTMAAMYGSREHAPDLHYVVFDVPVLAGVDLRSEPWEARRERPRAPRRGLDDGGSPAAVRCRRATEGDHRHRLPFARYADLVSAEHVLPPFRQANPEIRRAVTRPRSQLAIVLIVGASILYAVGWTIASRRGVFEMSDGIVHLTSLMYDAVAQIVTSLAVGAVGIALLPRGDVKVGAGCVWGIALLIPLAIGGLVFVAASVG
jgi:hypothetical protein